MTRGADKSPKEQDQLLSVAQLTAHIKQTLEAAFPSVWVVGEVTDLARPRSGHVYLTLKDEEAQIRAVMWRGVAGRLRFDLEDGQEVVCRGDVDVYPPRGSYQLVIRHVEPRGMGSLQRALQHLQKRLAQEGLFDAEHKQALPRFPRRIAVVTSPTGAAIRDFLEVVRQRWQGVHILVLPTRVQGDGAAEEIARAIAVANRIVPTVDALVVTRGGGSMEDLWCFNEEPVVRAIFDSQVPVVSAVGHEIDVTLSDLAADVRAATPTEAAQRIVPSTDDVSSILDHLESRLQAALVSRAAAVRVRLDAIAGRPVFRRPVDRVRDLERRVDELQMRAVRAMDNRTRQVRELVSARGGQLESLSPLSVLSRGYSLTQREVDGTLVVDARDVQVGDRIRSRFATGETVSRIESVEDQPHDAERSP